MCDCKKKTFDIQNRRHVTICNSRLYESSWACDTAIVVKKKTFDIQNSKKQLLQLHMATCPRTFRPSRRSSTAFGGSMENRSSSLHTDILNVSTLTNLCLVCMVNIDCSSRDTKIRYPLNVLTLLMQFSIFITLYYASVSMHVYITTGNRGS
jgi:hypothetical protein